MADTTETDSSVSMTDETMRQLAGLPGVAAQGGWSLLLDVAALGLDCVEVSNRLLEHKVAATPMRGWERALLMCLWYLSDGTDDPIALVDESGRHARAWHTSVARIA
jgi:hypothetical protein